MGSDGKTYSLDQYKGKKAVVLDWFPKAFTGGCTAECKSFAREQRRLKPLNVAYFTASVDTPELNKKFAESLELDYPILSDPDKTVAKAYGVVHDGTAGRPSAGRSTSTRTASSRRSTRRSRPRRPAPTWPRRSRSWASPQSQVRRVDRPVLFKRRALEVEPAPLQLAQDPPEEPAVHPAPDPPAPLRVERVGSVYSMWWATSWRNVSKSSSSGRRPSWRSCE